MLGYIKGSEADEVVDRIIEMMKSQKKELLGRLDTDEMATNRKFDKGYNEAKKELVLWKKMELEEE